MVERKLQFTGGSSFIVSLPKQWVSKSGLKTGSIVHILQEKDGSLHITPKKVESGPKESTILKRGSTTSTLTNIVAAYIAGADKIIVKGKDTAEVCEEARLRLSGLEIVEEHQDKTVMQVFANEEDLIFATLLKRLYLVTDVMCNLAIRCLSKKQDLRREAQRRDNDADRLYLLIMRCLYNTAGPYSPMKATAVRAIERVADHGESICNISSTLAPNPALASLLKEIVNFYSEAVKCIIEVKFDESLLDKHKLLDKRRQSKMAELIKRERNKEKMMALITLEEDFHRILNYSMNLVEMAANMSYVGESHTEA